MDSETPPVFVAIIQDITESEKREDQLRQSQKMEAIGQLTGGIAHDFNNLLTVIQGNNELLADMIGENELMRELLDDATSAAEHGARLTSQLLAFARQQPLDPHVINLNDTIDEMSDMLRRSLGEAIELQTRLDPKLSDTIADPVQVHNALLNLTINARDAMPEGGKLVIETSEVDLDADAAEARIDAEPGHYIRVSVRDTGAGMSQEVRAKVLEPFFTTKEVGRGTGLGLSMVHGFAKQSGGFLEVYSEVGFGTAISFYLPLSVESDIAALDLANPKTPKTSKNETILVVEDDPRVRKITVKRLEHLGYQAIEAESGQEAGEEEPGEGLRREHARRVCSGASEGGEGEDAVGGKAIGDPGQGEEQGTGDEAELDARGLLCPEPVMMLHSRISDVAPGKILRVIATDPSTTRDIPRFCQFLGHELVSQVEQGDQFIYLIRRGE